MRQRRALRTADALKPARAEGRSRRPEPARAGQLPAVEEIATAVRALPLALDAVQVDRLFAFLQLLSRWNAVHNLTAIGRSDELLSHHLLDSLAIVPLIDALDLPPAARVLDVGSGGGLPGIPLAIARPSLRVTVLDKVQKKTAFMEQARMDLALPNLTVVNARVEAWRPEAPFDLIVSRAFAALDTFAAMTLHLLASQGRWLAMKGPGVTAELERLPQGVVVERIDSLTVPRLAEERRAVVLRRA